MFTPPSFSFFFFCCQFWNVTRSITGPSSGLWGTWKAWIDFLSSLHLCCSLRFLVGGSTEAASGSVCQVPAFGDHRSRHAARSQLFVLNDWRNEKGKERRNYSIFVSFFQLSNWSSQSELVSSQIERNIKNWLSNSQRKIITTKGLLSFGCCHGYVHLTLNKCLLNV